MDIEKDLQQALDIKRYINKDLCRSTLKLREEEQGYNNGRPISMNKQIIIREEQSIYSEDRMRIAKPIYRLMYGTQIHLVQLAEKMKKELQRIGVHIHEARGLTKQVQLRLIDMLDQLYIIYKTTLMMGEEHLQMFEKNGRNYLMDYRADEIIIVNLKQSESLQGLYQLFYMMDDLIERIMAATLRNEDDANQHQFEYGTFNELIQQYESPKMDFKYVYNWEIEQDLQDKDQEEQIEIVQDRESQNYIKEFFNKFQSKLKKASPEYYQLLLFDILRDLSNTTLDNHTLELKFYEQLKSVSAAQYLLIYRKEIILYLEKQKFWDAPQQNNKQQTQTQTISNHQLLSKIGIDVEKEGKLGLRKQDIQGNDRKQVTIQEGIAEFDPEQYAKMEQSQLVRYFPTSTKSDRVEYSYVRIDPLPKKKIQTDNLVKIKDLPNWAQKAFDGTDSLNVIQSQIYQSAFKTKENLLVCAPTGAGKTNIALLTILQQIGNRIDQQGVLVDKDFKIVYISPMKALASEIVDKFSNKLKYLGIKVKEFTGDMQLSKKELSETHIILTTPEKWDVITRKSNQISEQLQLLIIDEVHLLNDERGPILECVVARTLLQVQRAQRHIRLVGLSATLPNYWDVAIFLECHKENVFFFDQTFRPVPLCQKFIGVKEPIQSTAKGALRRTKKDIQNEQTYEILREVVKHNKQVLVFVHSRKETVKYAQWIQERAIKMKDYFLIELNKISTNKIMDNELKKLLPYGVACHHAGMLRQDRNSVERFFLNGEVRVLVATATLAWGVNLPAYAVIIKGTDIFDISRADMQNLSVLDVQQMFGRAGRPQFDDQGEATLITDFKNMGHYMGMLNNASYIESKLLGFLKEALNAEIVLGNITNYQEAYKWMNHTFLSIRLRRNGLHYGVVREHNDLDLNCDILVSKKIEEALIQLDQLKLVRYDRRNQLVTSTELGRIASHYYIKCETMKLLCDEMGISFDTSINNQNNQYKTIYQLLKIVAKAKEFEQIRLRPEETKEIQQLYDKYWVFEDYPTITFNSGTQDQYDGEELVIQNEEKIIGLISGYIAQTKYENYALVMDSHIVIQNAIRLCRCMLEMAIKKNQAQMTLTLIRLCKLIENRMSERQNPLFQFSKEIFQGYNSRKIMKGKEGFIPQQWLLCVAELDKSAQELYFEDINVLASYLHTQPFIAQQFRSYVEMIPYVEVETQVKPISATILQIVVFVIPRWKFNYRWHLKNEPFWIFVDDGIELLHSEEFLISEECIQRSLPMQLSFYVPFNNKFDKYTVTVTSDRWIMRDELEFDVDLTKIAMEEDHIDFTDLLDLQPLPITALANPQFESLFKYKYFNPIQTQVFFSLYHTDDNVLIGAPTGSGKTIMAELAMLRIFAKHPEQKVIYIAPLKAIAKERLQDWIPRLEKINKKVLELTGDYTPDLSALISAHVLITTPEKWDGISRTWNTRQYVKQAGLLIFDEIHLLGQDRGPVLEVIVSRMNSIAGKDNKQTRMIGLSTAMANGMDVSNWFGVAKHKFFNFKPSCRPVPVEIHFNGFPERAYCPRMATMNKPCYQDIKRYSEGKPTIIFVSSRRQTRLTALDLIALAMQEGNEKQYIMCSDVQLEKAISKVEDDCLKQVIAYGIGIHHSGLQRNDRQIVEDMFLNGQIQLLIATSTVAWGVNFPARLVIIKGTEFYDPKLKKYVDFPVTDLLQMIGRAGRPQFDTQATACVYVEQSKKNFYRKYLNSPFPIESNLLAQIADHVNAEIQSGVISNSAKFIDWVTWTYFFRRLVKNPTFYGCQSSDKDHIQKFLEYLVKDTIEVLVESGCVVQEEGQYLSTHLGKLSSLYYLRHQTMKHYKKEITNKRTIEELLKILSYSDEFNEVPVRHNEDNLNAMLATICPIKPDMKQMSSPNEKTFLLLQSYLFKLKVPIKDFEIDTKLVLDSCIRMIHCMIDLSIEQKYLKTTLNLILIMQMIVQGFWFEKQNIIKNIPNCEKIEYSSIKTFQDLLEQQSKFQQYLKKELSQIKYEQAITAIKSIPKIKCHHRIEQNKVIININDQSFNGDSRVQIQGLSKVKDASWWIILAQEDTILQVRKAMCQKNITKEFNLPEQRKDLKVYELQLQFMKIDFQLYLWLVKYKLIPERQISNEYVDLEKNEYEQILSGELISKLLQQLTQININVKQGSSKGIMLYNWNMIQSSLLKQEFNIEDDMKMAIVKGDWEMIQQLLRELRLHFDNQSFIDQQLTTDKHSTTNISEPQELEIQQIDIQKPLIQTNSLLEFIIISLSQHLDLKPQQAVILLNNSHKQLNNILINGHKKSFKSLINWLIDLSKNTTFILRFQFNIEILFSLLKAGLASKSPEVCYWTIFIYQNILQILIDNQQTQLIEDCYAWFVREHSGLIATILTTKKHPQFIDQICSLYSMLSSYNINDFFDVQLRKLLKSGKEYIDFINLILEPLSNRDQLAGQGMMEFFASHAFKLFDIQHSYLEKMSALKYFEQYWIYYPELFEQSVVDGYLVNVRKATRDQNNLLRIFSFISLFRILDNLAMRKDKYASLIYKKLVFSLIENFDEKEIRDVLISNFRNLILKYSAIPIDILLIPMIKQLQIHETESMISITDFQLLKETCTHPKMELNLAIQMLDILCKLYMNSIIFHQIAFQQIQLLLSRFIESEPTREFAFNVTKIALAEYYGSFSEYIKNYPKVFLINNQDNKILQQQYRSQMIQLVRFIIHLRQFDLNEQIKNVILHFYLEIHTVLKADSKGLTMLLQYFGDVPILLEEYQQQQQQKQQKQQQNSSRITQKPYHVYNNNQHQLQTQQINHKQDVTNLYDDPFWELKITESEQIPKNILQTISLDDDEQKLLKQFDTL